jgi:hypothetical protein
MSMFDSYEPTPPVKCASCGGTLSGWQGQYGPCALLLWVQGRPAPVDQLVSEECQFSASDRASCRLPERFLIYTWCEQCRRSSPIIATGLCEGGVWAHTVLGDQMEKSRA